MSQFFADSIFWVEVDKVHPNPFQPRREFDEARLADLADSIRMYGVLQPLVVTRQERQKEDGGLAVEYELISGERRLRASRIAGLLQVPVLIRSAEQNDREKLEIAIIENIQREDLNVVDRARAFHRLVSEFNFKHSDIARKVGKSREYVSNSIRVLSLPEDILAALSDGKITEGHTRPILMLIDRPDEQSTLFKEIMYKKLTVRESEQIARKIAFDRARKKERIHDPELAALEEKLQETLGTRVHIEQKEDGGKILIDFFSPEDLRNILERMEDTNGRPAGSLSERYLARSIREQKAPRPAEKKAGEPGETPAEPPAPPSDAAAVDDRSKDEIAVQENEDIYSVKNFTV